MKKRALFCLKPELPAMSDKCILDMLKKSNTNKDFYQKEQFKVHGDQTFGRERLKCDMYYNLH